MSSIDNSCPHAFFILFDCCALDSTHKRHRTICNLQIRKEKDEHSIAELRVQMAGMDRSLSTEIKRRIDEIYASEIVEEKSYPAYAGG